MAVPAVQKTAAPAVAPAVWPGRPAPLGATFDGEGTNFALFSEVAERVELCLFDDDGNQTSVDLPEVTGYCWHGYLPEIGPGQRYGYRVHGPWAPEQGQRCNAAKLLLDPYARAVDGEIDWSPAVFPYAFGDEEARNEEDSAPHVPKAVVTDGRFDWGDDRPPATALHDTVVYELHVKGFTVRHPKIPQSLRGTYAGLAHPAAIEHLTSLGVTAVELMPVHEFVHDAHLVDRGLRNYWGYNSIGFFAPHGDYAASGRRGEQVAEFKSMVKALHAAGIEVILDVVYNHTAEGNHLGPMLSLKGIDNAAYYRLVADGPRHYFDTTGTGNSLNMRHPHVLQLIMDSLRYWVEDDRLAAFFDLVQQDPVVSAVKLIAEPWDVGDGGYQVGNFPPLWSEWNGKYRDVVRDFWRGEPATLGEFAARLSGSADLYATTGRRPYASINFVTAHDGFTLRDLVSFNDPHNEANGEGGTDGEHNNRAWNCGAEGETTDADVLALRARQQRNFLATLFLSQGVPHLLAGDELGRTQGGNNNGYCQDNEISWLDWENADADLYAFTRRLIMLRRSHPVFRRRGWFQGRAAPGRGITDIAWFTPDGVEMAEENWREGFARSVGLYLDGGSIAALTPRGEAIVDDRFYVLCNAHHELLDFTLPHADWGRRWSLVIDTASPVVDLPVGRVLRPGDQVPVEGRAVVVLRCARQKEDGWSNTE